MRRIELTREQLEAIAIGYYQSDDKKTYLKSVGMSQPTLSRKMKEFNIKLNVVRKYTLQ